MHNGCEPIANGNFDLYSNPNYQIKRLRDIQSLSATNSPTAGGGVLISGGGTDSVCSSPAGMNPGGGGIGYTGPNSYAAAMTSPLFPRRAGGAVNMNAAGGFPGSGYQMPGRQSRSGTNSPLSFVRTGSLTSSYHPNLPPTGQSSGYQWSRPSRQRHQSSGNLLNFTESAYESQPGRANMVLSSQQYQPVASTLYNTASLPRSKLIRQHRSFDGELYDPRFLDGTAPGPSNYNHANPGGYDSYFSPIQPASDAYVHVGQAPPAYRTADMHHPGDFIRPGVSAGLSGSQYGSLSTSNIAARLDTLTSGRANKPPMGLSYGMSQPNIDAFGDGQAAANLYDNAVETMLSRGGGIYNLTNPAGPSSHAFAETALNPGGAPSGGPGSTSQSSLFPTLLARDPYTLPLPALQEEYETLRREYELAVQKLNSTMTSIKTFWSPELKKERALRKEETAKLSLLGEQLRMASQDSQVNSEALNPNLKEFLRSDF